RVYELEGRRSALLRIPRILQVQSDRAWLVAQRKDEFVPTDSEIQNQIISDLAGPQPLQNVRGLDLFPASVLGNKLIRRVAAEEAILFVVKPDEAELVFLVDLKVAPQIGIGLVIDVDYWIASSIGHCENSLSEVITPVRSE